MPDRKISRCERGEGRLGFLFTLLILAAGGYFVSQSAPHYIHKVQMQDATTEIVRIAAMQNLSESDVRSRLSAKVHELDLPRDTKIEVKRSGKLVNASVSYTQNITLPFYTCVWPVSIQAQESGF
ncbi:MAG TPA: hypothetical protein VNQ79_08650 [Blastocatellia bacterium]|nr:hypothetical protein [Blastocatellia bacterium]